MKKTLILLIIFGMLMVISGGCRSKKGSKTKPVEKSTGLMPLHYKTHIKDRDKNTSEKVKTTHPIYISAEVVLSRTYRIRVSWKDENGHDFMVDSVVTETKKINTKEEGTIIETNGSDFSQLYVSFAIENDPLLYRLWFDRNANGNYQIRGGASNVITPVIVNGNSYSVSTSPDCHLLYKDNYKRFDYEIEGEADGNPGKIR